MNRVRVKFCGIVRVDDALEAARLGVDAIGMVFTSRSVRQASVDQARAVRAQLPGLVSLVGLFMDQAVDQIEAVLAAVRLDLLQFHGNETEADCKRFGVPYLKAIAMGANQDAVAQISRYPSAAGFVLDAHEPGTAGGTGKVFDWSRIPAYTGRPLVLAGGMTADNVVEAIQRVRPYAVDVSSGIEAAPGCKDSKLMRQFMAAVAVAEKSI